MQQQPDELRELLSRTDDLCIRDLTPNAARALMNIRARALRRIDKQQCTRPKRYTVRVMRWFAKTAVHVIEAPTPRDAKRIAQQREQHKGYRVMHTYIDEAH